jgi:hypothetical protein
MIGAFWNFIGLNKSGRLSCLANFVKSNKLDFVGIQETKSLILLIVFLSLLVRV